MNDQEKQLIADLIFERIRIQELSDSKFARQISVSQATISCLRNGRWDMIRDRMWRKLASVVEHAVWQPAETYDFRTIRDLAATVQAESISIAMVADAGSGKTFTGRWYADNHPRVYYLECAASWTQKTFFQMLLRSMGMDPEGKTLQDLIAQATESLRRQDHPLIILDEADKLRDAIWYHYVELYNKLDGICGFLFMGTPFLRDNVTSRSRRNKKGFREIHSRLGRRFQMLRGINRKDVEKVCRANGVTDPEDITEIWNDCEGDLRRVRRMILRHQIEPTDSTTKSSAA